MHSSPKLFIFIIQMMALIAIQLETVLGTASSLDSAEKTDISPLKASDINNYEKSMLTKEALDSDLMDSYDEEKRAQKWNNLQGGWGKRANWNNKLSAAWGKRPAGGSAAGWNNLSGMWGKRAWNELNGMWGKRGWNDMSGGWGKRNSPHWNKLRGMWGKRSVSDSEANDGFAEK
ncbi:unnamed protein product [Medioppia subpectinata]|uniref:Uncharacterized protein n=1 Tax=Medioppia subpectinata TaxID=1979941 RepID=A0A7R9KZ94_9ACAR|nr:unnamed protein product [Medioppia subpectinata]CAG2111377.1 unnamed protein product [Medioppia subpectinata]